MANSRSNIYPIQLQGAELNLNKFDAEIKQYNGFNKNNSPFVGGCLSNVFTKDEDTQTSPKQFFIDDKGEKYQVSYINGFNTCLISTSKKGAVQALPMNKFFENKKLSIPSGIAKDEVVKFITDDLFVTCDFYDVNNYDFNLRSRSINNFRMEIGYQSSLPYEKSKIMGRNMITNIFVSPDGTKNYCILGYVRQRYVAIYVIDMDLNESGTYDVFSQVFTTAIGVSYDEPISICYDEGYTNQFSIYYRQSGDPYKVGTFFTIDFVNRTISQVGSDLINIKISTAMETSEEKLMSRSLEYYHILNYPANEAVLMRPLSGYTYLKDQTAFKLIGRLKTPYMENDEIKFREKTLIDYPGIKTVAPNGVIKMSSYNDTRDRVYTPWMCCFDIQLAVSDVYGEENVTAFKSWIVHQNSTDYALNGFSFYDYEDDSNYRVLRKGRYALGDFVPLGKYKNFYLGFNNNQLSSVCGKYVLLTEWNSILPENIQFYNDYRSSKRINGNYDERIYYKCNDEWFEIRMAAQPSIKLFGDQLVINADSITNSFRYKNCELLHFATPCNSIVDSYNRKSRTAFYEQTGIEDNVYVGWAIREYDQKDNSSIILNPVSFYIDTAGHYDFVYNFLANCFDEYVNIYSNIKSQSSVMEYYYSVLWDGNHNNFKVDWDLKGLPFPLDSNGNVEYNVNLFSEIKSIFATTALIVSQLNSYPLVVGNDNKVLMNYYLASGVEGLTELFVIQGQYYGVIDDYICSLNYNNGVISGVQFIVSVEGLQFCGNTPYEALFFSNTNKCLYSFIGSNVLQQKQLVDKIDEIKTYKYNPATQSVILITNIGAIVSSLFGVYLIEKPEAIDLYIIDNGIILYDETGKLFYIKYYNNNHEEGYTKQNILVDTCFYGMNNQTVTINDCLYFRLFSEEHEEGELKVSATTISLKGRKTETTTFKIKASDWDAITHTIYLRYQPKEQRGLGVSFSIDSPFKIASLSVGSQPDAILIDKVSKGAINAPSRTSNNDEW